MAGPTIPVVLCVDLEPDGQGHLLEPGGPWSGVGATHEWLDSWRPRIVEATGRPPVFTWFLRMDPQIAGAYGSSCHVATACPTALEAIARRGEPVGLHVHAWRGLDGGGWVDDYVDRAWLDHCLDVAFAAYADLLGRPCRLHRFGIRWFADDAPERLRSRGARVDLSMEPGFSGGPFTHVRGDLPDHRRTPRRPHRLAEDLVELPLTATGRRLGLHPKLQASRARRHRHLLDLPLRFGVPLPPGDDFGWQVRRSLRHQRRPHLVMAMRSDTVLDPARRARMDEHLGRVLAVPGADRLSFVGPEEAVELLGGA